jgi:hypothetical protein
VIVYVRTLLSPSSFMPEHLYIVPDKLLLFASSLHSYSSHSYSQYRPSRYCHVFVSWNSFQLTPALAIFSFPLACLMLSHRHDIEDERWNHVCLVKYVSWYLITVILDCTRYCITNYITLILTSAILMESKTIHGYQITRIWNHIILQYVGLNVLIKMYSYILQNTFYIPYILSVFHCLHRWLHILKIALAQVGDICFHLKM